MSNDNHIPEYGNRIDPRNVLLIYCTSDMPPPHYNSVIFFPVQHCCHSFSLYCFTVCHDQKHYRGYKNSSHFSVTDGVKEFTRNRILEAILLWWPRYVVVQRIHIPQKQITGGLVRGIKQGRVFVGLCWEKLLAYSLLREKHQFE